MAPHRGHAWSKLCPSTSTTGVSLKRPGQTRGLWTSTGDSAATSKGESPRQVPSQTRPHRKVKALDKDFFVSVIGSSTTKRDARAYLQSFKPEGTSKGVTKPYDPKPIGSTTHTSIKQCTGMNLGSLYQASANSSTEQSSKSRKKTFSKDAHQQMHIALVKIRRPQDIRDDEFVDIVETLSQLNRLGLKSIVVLDTIAQGQEDATQARNKAIKEAHRCASILDKIHGHGSRVVEGLLIKVGDVDRHHSKHQTQTSLRIGMNDLLTLPLRRGVIPVVPCVATSENDQSLSHADANSVLIALTRELAGLNIPSLLDDEPAMTRDRVHSIRKMISLDRLIVIDPLGGIPASDRVNGYHVFLNMQQEYATIKDVLSRNDEDATGRILGDQHVAPDILGATPVGRTEPVDKISASSSGRKIHLDNLELVHDFLSLLPPSSSALLTTPHAAANSHRKADASFHPAEVGTRRQRNPLIYNLLTDKPILSPSLPGSRLSPLPLASSGSTIAADDEPIHYSPTTFAKQGMPVTIFPDPQQTPWEPEIMQVPSLSLKSPLIDLPRLIHLIEDSFGRALDVPAYLARIGPRLAGLIIAGEYEGGALLTWELPPGVPDDGSMESRRRMVPYLDKFAVLKRSQGAGGVADIVFRAMVKECLPGGVVWRSRKDNPVNKWYFERARSTYKLPDSNWTMFFTTPEDDASLPGRPAPSPSVPRRHDVDRARFLDYVAVCRSIQPSWQDLSGKID